MVEHKMQEKIWNFKLIDTSNQCGTFCIAGDCEALGNWSTEKITPLVYDENTNIWSVSVRIPADRDIRYRYFTCTIDESSVPAKTMIHRWETNLNPRVVKEGMSQDESKDSVDVFGFLENNERIENGWLTSDLSVQLRLNSKEIQWQSSNDSSEKISLKVLSTFQHNTKHIQCRDDCSEILISVSNESGRYRKQDPEGYSVNDVESAIFKTRAFSIDKLGFVFEFTHVSGEQKRKLYSFLVLENKSRNSDGTVTVPIHSEQREYIGALPVKYLIIRPTTELNSKFEVSYAKYWNSSWTGLEIGHRGSGVSFRKDPESNSKFRENTIGSFKSAGEFGAHLIEFDVQLTNDLVPTIYHDFHVLLDVRKKNMQDSGRKMIFPVHKLNFEELRDFKVHHLSEVYFTSTFENDHLEEYSPFPSLEEVLQTVDSRIGCNIEIKYNSKLMDGSNELDHPIDMNEYVDRILKVVYANSSGRYIVFSSFNPDVCCMVRSKQNKFPVMFLTQGVTKRYPSYSDDRMKTIENAVRFANSVDLLGIVAHSEDLLKNYDLVKYVLNSNLVLFCWGEDNNNVNNICALKEQGVHGVIFDRMDRYGQRVKKDFSETVW